MHHGPAQNSGPDPASGYKSKLGVWMFIVYCLIYAGFVFLNVLTEGQAMQIIVFAGLNLAVVYGMGLIIIALVLALIYNALCTAKERELLATSGGGSKTEAVAVEETIQASVAEKKADEAEKKADEEDET